MNWQGRGFQGASISTISERFSKNLADYFEGKDQIEGLEEK